MKDNAMQLYLTLPLYLDIMYTALSPLHCLFAGMKINLTDNSCPIMAIS